MAASSTCSSSISCPCSCPISSMDSSFFPLIILFLTISLLSISLLLFFLFKRPRKTEEDEQYPQSQTSISALKLSLSKLSEKTLNTHQLNPTQLPHSVFLELCSPKWVYGESGVFGSGGSGGEEERKKRKKKKKRGKKKEKGSLKVESLELENGVVERVENEEGSVKNKDELVCLYPFTSSSSLTQRKIKQQYDQLVRSHESKGLTLAQVGQFVNCLVDAKNELQHKSESVKRKFTITKALLLKADRSSFDRLRQQICKLELEQKRLEEDAFVYNWLQHQLKLSPAYKKMVEIGTSMELKAKSNELTENVDTDTEQNNISFEEFLAKEKKDTFWQKHGKIKSCTGVSHPA